MAISYGAAGVLGYSTGNPVAAVPAGITAGQYLVLLIGSKPDTATATDPAGWTSLGVMVSTSAVGTGIDVGPTRVRAYGKVAVGGETAVTVVIAGNSVSWAQMLRFSNATGSWSVATATGEDLTGGTAFSATMSTNPGITAGDMCLVAASIPTDVTTPAQFTAENITATGISAWGTSVEVSEPDSALGQDIGGFVFYKAVTTGTSTAAPVVTATAAGTTTNVYGPTILIRLREQTAPTVALNTPTDTATGVSTTPNLVFTGTDAQSDAIEYNVQVDTVNTFNSQGGATPLINALSTTDAGFTAGHPFASGVGKTYTVQNGQDATIDSFSEANYDSDFYTLGQGTTFDMDYGQSFTGNGLSVTSCKFYLKKVGSPTFNLTAKIYALTGTPGTNATPTGSVLATSNSVAASSLATSHGLITFTFITPYTPVNATDYFILVSPSGNTGTSDYVVIGANVTSPADAGANGCRWKTTFNSWASMTADFPFYLYHATNNDALTALTQYFWRVRGIDPGGSNTWGAWSSTWSFTVAGGIKVWNGSTWGYKPAKVWNGTVWVAKPIKVWNGTTWAIKG